MGLLDELKQYIGDAMPGGLLNSEITKKRLRHAGETMSMMPNPMGDVASGLLAIDDVRQGNYGEAALNGLGLVPFVPAVGAMTKLVKDGKNYSFLAKDGTRIDFPQVSRGVYEAHTTLPSGQKYMYGDGLEGVGTIKQWLADMGYKD